MAMIPGPNSTGLTVVELHSTLSSSGSIKCQGMHEELEKIQEACENLVITHVSDHSNGPDVAIRQVENEGSGRDSVVRLLDLRLEDVHQLTPKDTDQIEMDRMSLPVFYAYINQLIDGELVEWSLAQAQKLLPEIGVTKAKLKKFRSLEAYQTMKSYVNDSLFQREQILLKVEEFRRALQCLAKILAPWELFPSQEFPVFVLGSHWTWSQLHRIVQRECTRLQAQLPLYAHRSEIISQIQTNQVVVLVGETGSGKSTQLVQYLYDAGLASDKSIVCTQPRKVAALNLTQRVREESDGCVNGWPSGSVSCITSSSAECYRNLAATNFTTDFVLLQFCLIDPLLSKFNCVVVDEAHERSLNTDLLLGMLKSACLKRKDLKVIIMSATADAEQLSAYFGSDGVLKVPGRNFPVQVIYEARDVAEDWKTRNDELPNRVVEKVKDLHVQQEDGNILAFLTSPAEVDWACGQDFDSSACVLPLHGKLQQEDLRRVFEKSTPGRRKIVFATNFAETSLTIPDIKFVVDCGLAKESIFDPKKGMNVLQVGSINKSSAIQRAGRAGRTQPGVCYRLYSRAEFEDFASHRLPEVRRVHLGVAILKLIALGIKEVEKFDFVESPDPQAILLALRTLNQLGAIKQCPDSGHRFLTGLGWNLVKLAIEPRIGKILLDCIHQGYALDGVVIAALMSNSGSVFYRSGSEEVKERADRLKMRFCHPHGELFTLLSVYQEWDSVPERSRNQWCVRNCISSKVMRRCRDQVMELRSCLRFELKLNVPWRYGWWPAHPAESSTPLRKIIFGALAANLAVSTGHDRLGYSVLSTDQQALLHPSSSILVFGTMPDFVVYWEIVQTSNTFLDLVTVVEPEWIRLLGGRLQYEVDDLQASIMRQWVIPMTSSNFLSRVSGKQRRNLNVLRQAIEERHHGRCVIDLNYGSNVMIVHATSLQMAYARELVQNLVSRERRWMVNETVEKPLVANAAVHPSPKILVSAGAAIKDVLMPGESACLEVFYNSFSVVDEKDDEELLEYFDQCGGGLTGFERQVPNDEKDQAKKIDGLKKWGVIRYNSRQSALQAMDVLDGLHISRRKTFLEVRLLKETSTNSFSRAPFSAVKATLAWARRKRKGWATVKCDPKDTLVILAACQVQPVRGYLFSIKPDRSKENSLFLMGLDSSVDEADLEDALFEASGCRILDCYMPRSSAPILEPSIRELHDRIVEIISKVVPTDKFQVHVSEPNEKDYLARAALRFDESVHDSATTALKSLEGLALPGCKSWQTISCQRLFSSQVHMSRLMCSVLKQDLIELVAVLQEKYVDTRIIICSRESGAQRVQLSGPNLAAVARCKSSLEKMLEGQAIGGEGLDESVLRLLFTKRGSHIARAVENLTKTLVICDKRTQVAKIYGPQEKKIIALEEIVSRMKKLASVVKSRQIPLRGRGIPAGLMREMVRTFGLDLKGLSELGGGSKLNIDHRSHLLSVEGGDMEAVEKIQKAVAETAQKLTTGTSESSPTSYIVSASWHGSDECHICFCQIDDSYCLESCGHSFCRSCLINQIKSSIHHKDGFPLTCACEVCPSLFVLADIMRLLTLEQQEDLFRASLSAFVTQNATSYKFCTTADCPNVYRTSIRGKRFTCAACSTQICTACHVEYHEDLSCEEYAEFRLNPEASLEAWREGKEDVKNCPCCGSVIEKVDGCNHMTCICGKHVCWVCLLTFSDSTGCYDHLRTVHDGYGQENLAYLGALGDRMFL